jgi:hypothetical protein
MWSGVRAGIDVAGFVEKVGELIFSEALQWAAGGCGSIGSVK